MTRTPNATPMRLPEGYGNPNVTLDWSAVRQRLEHAEQYWFATTLAWNRSYRTRSLVPDGVNRHRTVNALGVGPYVRRYASRVNASAGVGW
jgi:hypothetical protein